MTTKAQLAQYCADHFPHTAHSLFSGVPLMTQLMFGGVASALAFALGWYIKGRGMSGVQIDLNNVKTDVENLKSKVLPTSAPVVVTTPVSSVTTPVA